MLDCLDSRKYVSLKDKSTRNIDKIFVTSNEWKLYNNIENIVGSQYTPHTIECYLNKNFFLLILKLNLNALSKNYFFKLFLGC